MIICDNVKMILIFFNYAKYHDHPNLMVPGMIILFRRFY